MTEMLEGTRVPTDAELISGVRSGDLDAYGELFSRHADAARRLARQLTRGSDAEDLVSEAFTKVMGVLTDGGGPDVAFRAYLLTAIRRLYVDRVRRDSRLTNSGDMTAFDPGVPFQDTVVRQFESSAAARAFATLPERWQLVLWHLDVENQKPADVAPLLGMSPNSVCALAYRAREGLRQAFLTEHLATTRADDCRWTVERLSGYVRKGLAGRDTTKVKAHLDGCRSCTAMHLELTDINSDLRGIVAPLLIGTAAAGYLAGAGSGLGVSSLVVLLGRVRDALLGAWGASAGTTTGAGAVGATGAGTTAGAAAGTAAGAAAGTAATTTAASTAAASTVAGVATGGAVTGVAAGTSAGVIVGTAAAGAATGASGGIGAAGVAMIAVGTAAATLGIGSSPPEVATAMSTTLEVATVSTPPESSPVALPEETDQADPSALPTPPSSVGAVAATLPSPPAELASADEVEEPNGESGVTPDESSGDPAPPDPESEPEPVAPQESEADEGQPEEGPPPSEPAPSPTLVDDPEPVDVSTSDTGSIPPNEVSDEPGVLPLEVIEPVPPPNDVLPEPVPQPLDPAALQAL